MRILGNKWVQLVTALLVSFGLGGVAHAHIGITDDTKQIAAVFRLDPDGSPEAGKATTITFDVKTQALLPTIQQAGITVINTANNTTDAVQVTINGGVVSGEYTFKTAGTYQLRLIVASGEQSYIFNHEQKVAAGPTAAATRTSPTIRSIGWLLVVIAIIVSVAAVALRRRLKR